jgi:excisionase family DNA binding protein
MNYKQLSRWLNLSVSSLEKLVHKNEIPYLKLNRAVRFNVPDIASWLLSKQKGNGYGN